MTQFESFEHDKFMAGSENKPKSYSDCSQVQSLHRFELISAYIDDELSASERKQVQSWIDGEPQMKTLYTQLLALQSQMQSLEAPTSNRSADEIADRVFQSLDRRRRQRRLMLGGSAIAASILATITGFIPGVSPGWKFAQSGDSRQNTTNMVMLAVALDKPAINIPKPLNGHTVGQPLRQKQL